METSNPPSTRRSGGSRRRGRLRGLRGPLATAAVLLLALTLPGDAHSGDVHALRTDLAAAKAELRIARAYADGAAVPETFGGGGSTAGAFAAGLPGTAREGDDPRHARYRVRVAEGQVRRLQGDVERATARVSGAGIVAGLLEQVRTLMRPPRDEETVGRLQAPARGIVTSGFGPRRLPSWGSDHMHDGIDIFAPAGTPVTAAAAGKVTFAGYRPESGMSVTVDHGYDHRGRRLHTVYSHLSTVEVSEGDRLRTGERLGAVGSTGSHSTGPHLHFEVRVEGQAVDPRAWL